jgi:hypothetical protein
MNTTILTAPEFRAKISDSIAITIVNMCSESFDFLYNEPDIYLTSDIITKENTSSDFCNHISDCKKSE